MTTEPFTHHVFTPIRADGDRRIVAAEAEWQEVLFLHSLSSGAAFRVEIGGDLFEPWEGPIHSERNRWDRMMRITPSSYEKLNIDHIRRRVFRMIDDCPHIDFLINTTRLKSVAEMLPTEDDGHGGKLAAAIFGGDDFPSEKGKLIQKRLNLWIGTTVSTQREADERILLLLGLPASRLWVRYVPGAERVRFRNEWVAGLLDDMMNARPRIDRLTIAGSLTEPTSLDHVRDIIAQGRAAGVPVWVERLGPRVLMTRREICEWHPNPPAVDTHPLSIDVVKLKDPNGEDPAEWPEDLRVREIP